MTTLELLERIFFPGSSAERDRTRPDLEAALREFARGAALAGPAREADAAQCLRTEIRALEARRTPLSLSPAAATAPS